MVAAGSNTNMFATEESNSDTERESSLVDTSCHKVTYGENIEGHVVDIDKWVSSMERILEDVPQYMCSPGHPGRLSRIPDNLREVDLKSYEPYFLSIGPYHNDKPRVHHMEKRKLLVLKFVLEQNPELTLKDYLKEIISMEPESRSFYSDVDMDSEKFVRMLLLDSLFIITVFRGMEETVNGVEKEDFKEMANNENDDDDNTQMIMRVGESNEQPKSGERWFRALLPHDLFLLENQLPFFVLQKMYALVYGGPETEFIHLMKDRVVMLLSDYTKLDPEVVIFPAEQVHHLLHLCHMYFRPTLQQDSSDYQFKSSQMFRLGSAAQLHVAGVSFEARLYSPQHSSLDITFSRSTGKMVIPGLYVDEKIASLLRNLVALEQMKYPSMGLHVSAYIVLLLHLVTTPEDVKLLRRKGIIQHHLASDKEMMYLVNKLSVGLSFDYVEDKYSLKPIFQELRRYSDRRVPRWRTWLRHRYFDNPWTTISLLAASLLLILSALQTFYAVYSYYRPCCDDHS